jgi:S-(hydroxymethyl)glutathione dehydrogenase/alcohol dehydrogenase
MKAAVLREVGTPLEVEEVEISKPGPREVLVRTAACGVCHSDLHFVEGLYPHQLPVILGHEAAGVVEQVGSDVRGFEPGDHVITCLSAFCGHCEHCLSGHMSLCDNPETMRGEGEDPRLHKGDERLNQFAHLSAFAEQMLIHEHALVKISKDMPFPQAALIGCGVTTGVGAVHNTARIEVGSTVAVIGCGGVGLACINGAAIAGASRIIAVDTQGSKLNLAKKFGATDVVDASDGNSYKQVLQMTNGGVHYSFEAIGLKATAEAAFKMLKRGGTATVIGMVPVGQMIEIHGAALLPERKIQGCAMGSNRFPVDMPRYVEFYMQGKLHLDELISQEIKLDQINEAFTEMKTGAIARSVITFDT